MRRTCLVTAGVVAVLSALPGVAAADAPTRTGWWNALGANGVALPQPTTGADDLHVGQGPTGATAYAAVAYDLTGQTLSGARLDLTMVPNTAVGTVAVEACPTKTATWKAGGNQTYDTRPDYDCDRPAPGALSADGTKITFLLDAPAEALAGYSLAIVPVEGSGPFMVDFAKPDATSLTPELETAQEPATGPGTGTAEPPPFAPTTGTSGSAPLAPATVDVPPLTAAAPVPALAAPAAPAPVAAEVPTVAPVTPAAAALPAVPVSNRERYIAGSMLALLAGAFVYALQQPTPEPRLIGGSARKSAPPVLPVSERPRGIGRFAAIRTAPARRLV